MTALREYVDAWRTSCADLAALAAELEPLDWPLPTDCAGWTVQDIFAHCTAIEAELAGDPRPRVHVDPELPHLVGPANIYTERGVLPRRALSAEQLRADFVDAVERRSARIDETPDARDSDRPELTPGGIDWDWQTLMRNRTIDIWVHEQDIRRAVGRPGHLDSVGARVTQETFATALPFVVAKRAAAEPGSTVVVDVTGPVSGLYAVAVDAAGRGHPVAPPPADPTVRLRMTTEELTILGSGRRDPGSLAVSVSGDGDLARRVLASMTLTI